MAELHLQFEKKLDAQIDDGVLTNIYPVLSAGATEGGTPKLKGVRGITIPVGSGENYRVVTLEAGNYQVECILPSGDIVTRDVELREGSPEQIVIRSPDSPHEWLTWQQFSGNISAQQLYGPKKSVSDRSIAPAVRDRIDEESDEVDPALLDFSHPATQALESGANPIWQDLVIQCEKGSGVRGDSGPDLPGSLNMIRNLVLSGLFEISSGSVRAEFFEQDKQWSSLGQLTGPDASLPLTDLMSRCMSSQHAGQDSGGLSWLSPDRSDQETSSFRLFAMGGINIRQFLLWTPAGAEFINLPREWMNVSKGNEAPIDVMIDLSNDDRPFRTSVTVQDTALSSALSYLTAGALPTAGDLFERARDMLFTKISNPYAAAAGAYLLLETREPKADDDWMVWIRNLYDGFPWLPDAAILHAWLEVRNGRHEAARDTFKEAFGRGVPLYGRGLKLLLDGLKLFASADDECAGMQKYVQRIAWCTNMQQIFTIVRLGVSPAPKQIS